MFEFLLTLRLLIGFMLDCKVTLEAATLSWLFDLFSLYSTDTGCDVQWWSLSIWESFGSLSPLWLSFLLPLSLNEACYRGRFEAKWGFLTMSASPSGGIDVSLLRLALRFALRLLASSLVRIISLLWLLVLPARWEALFILLISLFVLISVSDWVDTTLWMLDTLLSGDRPSSRGRSLR